MRDETGRERARDRRGIGGREAERDEREGLLKDLLRRLVGGREAAAYVMEPDGKVRRA